MFEHSIKVPRLFKIAAKLAKDVKTNNIGVKKAVFENKHVNKKALYALIMETLQHEQQIDFLLRKSRMLEKENRVDEWLARVLITELLWGKKQLPGDSKPIQTILAYQQIFQAHLDQVHADPLQIINKSVSKPRYVRVNTLSITVQEAVDGFRDEGWNLVRFTDAQDYEGFLNKVTSLGEDEFMVDIHVKELLLFPPNTQFYQHNAYKDGSILLQDKASCLPVQILNPEPGSVVLDMCAAPGMKTSQIAAMIKNEGTVYAVERDIKRVEILRKFVENSGATCVQTINKDVLTINEKECPNVDYILVDPSCSGSGITDRVEINAYSSKNDESRIKSLQGFQIKILKHALRNFANVKRVVYSTCSLNAKENEEVVKEVISSNQRFKLVPIQNLFTGSWFNFGSEEYGDIGKFCLYAKPDEDLTNGFFVAVFERLEDGEENPFFNTQWSNFVLKSRQMQSENNNGDTKNDRWKRRNKKLEMDYGADKVKNNNLEFDNDVEGDNFETESTNTEVKLPKKKKSKNLEGSNENSTVSEETAVKKSSKKKKKCENLTAHNTETNQKDIGESTTHELTKKSKKKKLQEISEDVHCVENDNLTAENNEEIKKKRKKKQINNTESLEAFPTNTASTNEDSTEKPKKKKRKHQQNETAENTDEANLELPKKKKKKHKHME